MAIKPPAQPNQVQPAGRREPPNRSSGASGAGSAPPAVQVSPPHGSPGVDVRQHRAHMHGGGKMGHQHAHAALLSLSDKLPAIPEAFDPDKMYRVRLKYTVKDGETHLRPSHDVQMSGKLAQEHRAAISGAKVV